ncbi:unnamed protein product [Closterium sp. NIES-54]
MANYLFGVEEARVQQTRGRRGADQRARELEGGDGLRSRTGAAKRARMARMEVRRQRRSGRRGDQQTLSRQPPSQQPPSQHPPTQQPPYQQPPLQQQPCQQPPSQQPPYQQPPLHQQPSQQPSSQQQPSQQPPSQQPHRDHGFRPMPTANHTRDLPCDLRPKSAAADNVHPSDHVTATPSELPSLVGEDVRDMLTTMSDSQAEADTKEVFMEQFDVEDGSQISCGEEPEDDEVEECTDMGHCSQANTTTTQRLSTTATQQAAMRRQQRMEIIRGRQNATEGSARGLERAESPAAQLPTQGSRTVRRSTSQQGVSPVMGRANEADSATDVNHAEDTGLVGLGSADAQREDSDNMEEGANIVVRTGQDAPRYKRKKKFTVFIKQWALCYAPTCRFGIYSSQMVESINNAIKKIRILPVSYSHPQWSKQGKGLEQGERYGSTSSLL